MINICKFLPCSQYRVHNVMLLMPSISTKVNSLNHVSLKHGWSHGYQGGYKPLVGPCAGHRPMAAELQGAAAADAAEALIAQPWPDWQGAAPGSSHSVSDAAPAPVRRLKDPFRADNRAGLSGAQHENPIPR